jgi:hypothetical protein
MPSQWPSRGNPLTNLGQSAQNTGNRIKTRGAVAERCAHTRARGGQGGFRREVRRKEDPMSLDSAIAETVKAVPDAVACGLVDMSTGMLIGVKTVDSHPQEVLDLVAAATSDLFQGSNVSAIEKLFKKARGTANDDRHYFQEIVVLSDNLIHVFLRGKKSQGQVTVVVTRASANLGMVLTKSRQAAAKIEAVA